MKLLFEINGSNYTDVMNRLTKYDSASCEAFTIVSYMTHLYKTSENMYDFIDNISPFCKKLDVTEFAKLVLTFYAAGWCRLQ